MTKPKAPGERKKTGPKGPTKLTPEVVGKLEQAFAIDATIEEACFYAGIDKTTYYDWKKKFPELSNRLEALRNTPILAARQTLATAVKGNPELALKYLERKRKGEFSLKTEQDVKLEMPKPILGGLSASKDGDAIPGNDSN